MFAYLPFIRKFKLKKLKPYLLATFILAAACAINISLKIPAQTLHIPEYLILSIFLYKTFSVRYNKKASYISATIISIGAGIVDERAIQYLLPIRVYEFADILLNAAGAIAGILLIFVYNMPAHKT